MAENNNIGWSFPMHVDELTGKIAASKLNDDIKQSLFVLLSTRRGERIMNPDYGCDLQRFAFESVTYALISQIEREVSDAIYHNEPRVKDVNVNLRKPDETGELSEEKLIIEINYTIVENAESDSLMYPMTINS